MYRSSVSGFTVFAGWFRFICSISNRNRKNCSLSCCYNTGNAFKRTVKKGSYNGSYSWTCRSGRRRSKSFDKFFKIKSIQFLWWCRLRKTDFCIKKRSWYYYWNSRSFNRFTGRKKSWFKSGRFCSCWWSRQDVWYGILSWFTKNFKICSKSAGKADNAFQCNFKFLCKKSCVGIYFKSKRNRNRVRKHNCFRNYTGTFSCFKRWKNHAFKRNFKTRKS